ncbi:hypothetical protein JXJ21_07160 [candidate division KSB1 bacterium]|nr:hypothetical protein [candidate division KSB1 bacterium]
MKYLMQVVAIISITFCLNCDDPVQIIQHEPVIQSIALDRTIVYVKEFVNVAVTASDADDDKLLYTWSSASGKFTNKNNASTQWQAPAAADTAILTIDVSDGTFTVSGQKTVIVKAL